MIFPRIRLSASARACSHYVAKRAASLPSSVAVSWPSILILFAMAFDVFFRLRSPTIWWWVAYPLTGIVIGAIGSRPWSIRSALEQLGEKLDNARMFESVSSVAKQHRADRRAGGVVMPRGSEVDDRAALIGEVVARVEGDPDRPAPSVDGALIELQGAVDRIARLATIPAPISDRVLRWVGLIVVLVVFVAVQLLSPSDLTAVFALVGMCVVLAACAAIFESSRRQRLMRRVIRRCRRRIRDRTAGLEQR